MILVDPIFANTLYLLSAYCHVFTKVELTQITFSCKHLLRRKIQISVLILFYIRFCLAIFPPFLLPSKHCEKLFTYHTMPYSDLNSITYRAAVPNDRPEHNFTLCKDDIRPLLTTKFKLSHLFLPASSSFLHLQNDNEIFPSSGKVSSNHLQPIIKKLY